MSAMLIGGHRRGIEVAVALMVMLINVVGRPAGGATQAGQGTNFKDLCPVAESALNSQRCPLPFYEVVVTMFL